MSTKVRISQPFALDDVALQVAHYPSHDRTPYAMKITFEPYLEGGAFPEDGMRVLNGPPMRELIQAVVDEAWGSGFRPSGYGDVKESTAAVKEHLKDMRAIAFHKLGISL